MADETLFGWVHLSDIHFGHGDAGHGWDQKLVLRRLLDDLAARRAHRRVDAVLVTGDVAFSGGRNPVEYAEAANWLRSAAAAARVDAYRVYVVPGNHDVNRDVDKKDRNVARLVQTLRPSTRPEPSLDEALRDPGDRGLLVARMAGYLEFAAAFGPWASGGAVPPAAARLFWRQTLTGDGGLRVRLVGLNTSLLCTNGDRGMLLLGREQLVHALEPPAGPDEIIVVLTHHPLRAGWLRDERNADAWLRNHAHVHLSGHVHEPDSEDARSGGGGTFVRVVAGAAHGEAPPEAWVPAGHGYSFGEVVRRADGKLVLRVHPRLWSDPQRAFVDDLHRIPPENVRAGKLHVDHELREVALPTATATALDARASGGAVRSAPVTSAPVASPPVTSATVASPTVASPPRIAAPATPAPLPTFISYAPADKAALERLEVHIKPLRREGQIEAWSAAETGGGVDARELAAQMLDRARLVLLLVSPDYLASDECYDVEVKRAVERHAQGGARVIPVLLRNCDYRTAPFAHLAFCPRFREGAEPPRAVYAPGVDPETRFLEVAEGIRAVVGELRGRG